MHFSECAMARCVMMESGGTGLGAGSIGCMGYVVSVCFVLLFSELLCVFLCISMCIEYVSVRILSVPLIKLKETY